MGGRADLPHCRLRPPLRWEGASAPLVPYALTMPRTVVLEDDGLFLMVGAHLGVAHPPGYPLHRLIVHLFLQLPFGPPALLSMAAAWTFHSRGHGGDG